MSHAYRAVGWNRQKRIYDALVLGGGLLYLAAFVGLGALLRPNATVETLLIRAFGTGALLLLHLILSIGPLCRLHPRFLPLLYNRRHLGVTMFLLALAHGVFSIVQFHALGDVHPLVSVLIGNGGSDGLSQFPFQPLGLLALMVLLVMAATSHDFWLANLTPPVWKGLHLAVYAAYALIVLHVALGALQAERHPLLVALLGLGLAWVLALHLVAGWRERALDRELAVTGADTEGFIAACRVDEIPEGRARVVSIAGERVAVFRYDGKVSAVSNVCQHQNGPLGEGRILDGCITCPWHGFQYDPETGASPPPFTEKVPTFRVRVRGHRVLVHPLPRPPGTRVEAARVESAEPAGTRRGPAEVETDATDFYIGYRRSAPAALRRFLRPLVILLLVGAFSLALTLVGLQQPFDPGVFEYGSPRELRGVVAVDPYPELLVERPASVDPAAAARSRYLLVAPGKRGAGALVEDEGGSRVRLRGTLIHRDTETMVEVEPSSLERLAGDGDQADSPPPGEDLGQLTLRGEIVDAKCFLGVMKPGRQRPHRACAVRCISGGVPPLLAVRSAGGEQAYLLLVDGEGRSVNRRVLAWVGEPIEVAGRLRRLGDRLLLFADLDSLRRASQ